MQDKAKHQENFQQAIEGLNPRQREAVDTTEGPVLVIAGPGTGKTQILAARIGHILATTDAQPENILCLTYTDAGTIAMRRRLMQFIGPDAYKVDIFTFHAFCNRVIKDNMEKFGMRALDSITELEQVEILHSLIDSFGPDHPLKRWTGDVYFDSYRLKRLFQLMKTENWSAEMICQKCDEYIDSLPEREEYIYKRAVKAKGVQKGDVNQGKIDEEAGRMEELKAAAREFPNYERMMMERKRYDYDDMILLVLNKFKEDEQLLRQYQEQYLYFLVDEFQDTNGAQNEILNLLVGYWDSPNVFAVGDDDQSIYRFQGANVANILDFTQRYDPKVVVMTDNYRSSQHILEWSRVLIESNEERLVNQIQGLSKILQANHNDFAETHIKPELRSYFNQAHESVGIAHEIQELQKQGVKLSEIAVIYRNHKQSEDVARYLESKNIPVHIRKKANILDSPFIRKILTILTYVNEESKHPFSRQDLLFEILHFDFYNTDPLVLAKLALELRDKRKGNDIGNWRQLIRHIESRIENTLFSNGDNDTYKSLKELSDNLEYWIKELHNTTLQVLFEKIMTRGGILAYVMNNPRKFSLMQELSTFFEFIKAESVKDPKVNVDGLLRTIKLMEDNKISLEINKTVYSEEGVQFVTAHSSKGLEFEYVYMIGCQKDAWDKAGKSGTFKFPDNLVTNLGQADESEEQRRLFYVALTRAKHHLYVSWFKQTNEGKDSEQSRFVQELIESEHVPVQNISLPDEDLLEYNMQVMKEQRLPDLQLLEENYLRRILESYSLSVTHLNTYLKCPVSFYYNYLLRIPVAKNQYMAFGSAVHFALERLFRNMVNSDDKKFPASQQLVRDFEWYMNRHQDSFTEEEFTRRMAYGQEILPKYYDQYVNEWNSVVSVERNLRAVVDGIPINGKLDKIEFDGTNANVVDYKTGKFDSRKKKYFYRPAEEFKKDEPTHEELYGGDYWRQAVFYKILVDNEAAHNWNVVSTEFDFVEPDAKTGAFHKEKVEITPEDLDTVRQQLRTAYEGIQGLQFSQGCNDDNCQWCNFLKSNFQLNPSEEEPAVDELEG